MPVAKATVASGSSRLEQWRPAGDLTRREQLASPVSIESDAENDRNSNARETIQLDNHNRQQNNAESGDESRQLSPFAEGYDARGLYQTWSELNSRLTISDWACYIRTGRRRKDRTQVDNLVSQVCCEVLGMREVPRYSVNNGQNCLLWLSNSLSKKYINHMRKGAHIVGRVYGDTILKDKQSMCNLFRNHMFREWLEYPKHLCSTEPTQSKRSLQRMCRHQYLLHCMSKCANKEDRCPNHTYQFCECFRRRYFLPESYCFSHYYMMEEFLKKYETDSQYGEVTWLAKPAYLTGGRGIFMIRNPAEFRFFFLVRSDTCVRREGFVLQRYLDRTCTMYQSKVDCRMYLLIIVLNGRRVCGFFHSGYTRIASAAYTKFKKNKTANSDFDPIFEHLTSGDLYSIMKTKVGSEEDDDENVQCADFNTACEVMVTNARVDKNAEKETLVPFTKEDGQAEPGGGEGKNYEKFQWRFKYIVQTICEKLDPIVRDKPGTFQIFGLDILIDSYAKPWLLEINSHVATERIYDPNQAKIVSNVVTESICLTCEMLQKSLQEEEMTLELQQGNARLSKLSRAQRLLTAMDQQKKLDELAKLLDQTEISHKKKPIFLKNFFWWYDTPRYRWIRPWIVKKSPVKKAYAWQSRMLAGLVYRSEALNKKTLKSLAFTKQWDKHDYHQHAFFPNHLENQIEKYETETMGPREATIRQQYEAENKRAGVSSAQ